MKKILLVICLFACCLISNNNHVFAMEQVYTEDEVLNIAFRGNVPEIMEFETTDDLNSSVVVFDSRYESISKAIFTPRAVPSNYDYYRTYNCTVVCKGTGAAAMSALNAHINFYINVFFKGTSCVGYENPVVVSINNYSGATGYSNPKVTVTSQTSSRITFKGSCILTAGQTFNMTGTSTLNVP